MRTAEIRSRWLDYFAKHDHHIAPSVPLVSPDPSILFTIAGMVPFIPYIVGTQEAPWPRAVSVQKCVRTLDIEEVGKTTRHGTFFQMNGNFSFGDYFKEGAITYAWDLLTTSQDEGGYGLAGDRLWVTIWEEDAEALDALTRIGVDPRQIVKLPREENFWDTGRPGPAGPCAEFHYDRGPEFGPDAVGGTVDPGGDRYLEIWNLVFDQFLRGEGTGKDYPLIRELDQKSIDTGAGLERIAYLLQGKNNMYEIDEVFPLIATTQEMTGRRYGADAGDDVRMRIIADHVRSALMLIGDGVRPGNDGRGYVLRRLIRRAVRSVRLLGVDEPALPHLLPVVRDAMSPSYPEVARDFEAISDVAYGEEEAFLATLRTGTTILDTAVSKVRTATPERPQLSGADAFALHDTYGFPIDLTLEMAAEQGVSVDEQGFRDLMAAQRDRARADAKAKRAAIFHRGEGVWFFQGDVYFSATTHDQIFKLSFSGARASVELVANDFNSPDNITVAPWGDLYVAEDQAGTCRIRIVAPDGTVTDFAANAGGRGQEFAGVCFAPDGRTLFVNMQWSGLTLAISGSRPMKPSGVQFARPMLPPRCTNSIRARAPGGACGPASLRTRVWGVGICVILAVRLTGRRAAQARWRRKPRAALRSPRRPAPPAG